MKKLFFLAAMFAACAVNAQNQDSILLFEEDFDYEAGIALVSNPVISSDNFDAVTGWSTQSNKQAAINGYTVVEGNLTYPDYAGGQYGNMLRHVGCDTATCQTVFKPFTEGVKNDSTVYVAFLLKLDNQETTAGDFVLGIKSETAATSSNWGGLLYAKVQTEYTGEEISFGIKKNSNSEGTWVNGQTGPFFAANQTMLIVIKYHVGLAGESKAAEEAGTFDDVMDLYVNPDPSQAEPATPTLHREDATEKDIYRWGSSKIFGAARAFMLRGSAVGNFPDYYLDGIRVALTWEDAMGYVPTAVENVQENATVTKSLENGQIVIRKNGVRYSVLGTQF